MVLFERVVVSNQNNPVINFKPGIACYISSQDKVRLPELNAFWYSKSFYSTIFLELEVRTGIHTWLHRPGVIS